MPWKEVTKMNLHEEQAKIQKAVNAALSGLQEDPWLARRVLANAKGEKNVKRKTYTAMVLSIVMVLAAMGTACALSASQVADFFTRHWNGALGAWLAGGRIAQIGETFSLGGVDFTLDEVVYRNRAIYGVGTARAKDPRDVLLPMDLTDGWETEGTSQAEEAQALIRQAGSSGGRLLSIDCTPEKVGVDGGSMVNVGDTGRYNLRNGDGSITFSFETGGYALEDGTSYQLALLIDVDEWTEEGMSGRDPASPQTWTVRFEPIIPAEAAPEQKAAEIPADVPQQSGYEILVPAAYLEKGTLPVYQAMENDFTAVLQPEWFNQTGIALRESDTSLTFRDHAVLQYSPDGIWYAEYTDELFDYNWRERETYAPDIEPMLLPKQGLSMGIALIASDVCAGNSDWAAGISLERDRLALISLEDAQKTAEALFDRLGLEGYELAWALDMSLERIRTLGEAYNRFWFEGEGYSNMPRQDYASAAVQDEGYYLVYTPLGLTRVSDTRHQISLFINSRGIAFANLTSAYRRGGIAYTPEKLISPQEAVARLYAEAARSWTGESVESIRRVALTYVALRAENKADGMVFAPVWQVLYKEKGTDKDYSCWAEFNAVSGTLIDAIFR